MSVRTYNPSVRVGNWNEDIQLEEDTLKDFLERRARGELLIQKSSNLRNSILKEVALSISRDGKVRFGDTVIIVNPEPCDKSGPASVLSVHMSNSAMHNSHSIQGPCSVTGSCNVKPSARTAFVIESMDGSGNGNTLKYGQPFYLRTAEGNLYLYSDRATFQKSAKKSRHNEVTLVAEKSHLTEWKIQSFDPQFRLEMEFTEVQANSKVIITHMKTYQNLSVEKDFKIGTAFGREYEISAFTDLDSHKAEKDANHWMVVMNVPGDNIMPVEPPKAEAPSGADPCAQ